MKPKKSNNFLRSQLSGIIAKHLLIAACLWAGSVHSQPGLQPGFNRQEYADVLWLGFYGISDSLADQQTFSLEHGSYRRVFRTAEVGLYNRAELYVRHDSVVVLNLRGTVNKPESWLENFYSAMVPASGTMMLDANTRFDYTLATNPAAAVHVGWLVGLGFLAREFGPVLEQLMQRGLTQLLVVGHSQGGALSFLATAYLHHKYSQQYPNLRIKNYASAAPKPGNQYFAYEFDFITRNGMSYRVVNALDWVPETAFSLQTLADFNEVNPFTDAKAAIKKQKLGTRVALNYVYRKLRNSSQKAQRRFTRYLGNKLNPMVRKALPNLQVPPYAPTNNYATAGAPVILMPNYAYKQQFVMEGNNVFVHHLYAPYLYLLNLHYPATP
ncbi:MAG TPA: lipase family protein [Phnomibacter sp.]|nr:lipase family protein [Phnomibacter sp.]